MTARRIDGSSTAAQQALLRGWELCATSPDAYATPEALEASPCAWIAATVPGTAAGAMSAAGRWSLDGAERRFDADDWWYRVRFEVAPDASLSDAAFEFDGLATICDIWLNGRLLLKSDNMYLRHSVAADGLRAGRNDLYMVFRALDAALKTRRPRPRWRAPMIENQQLRWHRTTVLGRTPGWSPPAAPVGPWKPVSLRLEAEPFRLERLRTEFIGPAGLLHFSGHARQHDSSELALILRRNGALVATTPVSMDGELLKATLRVGSVEPWTPHTHGEPTLYDVLLVGTDASGTEQTIDLGKVGFRNIELRHDRTGGFAVAVNGLEVFCRGACWTPLDVVSLQSDEPALRRALEQVRDAGFNMLRISGAFVYEDDRFFAMCDQLGIMVWQEFMFANMDYPASDGPFMESVRREAEQQLRLWARHPCVTLICGNSEVSQQASMWGTPREQWSPALYTDILADLARQHCPGSPYWPSSAHGGDFPHQVDSGTASYYGVGAYLRSFDDLRRSGVKFATECLGFANVPEPDALEALPGGSSLRVHHALWKRRAPRDLGAGWDFDDVRDHYLRVLFGIDPFQLRYADHTRYLEMSRRVPAETMTAAFTEWRRPDSQCGGALIWFLRDLWPGAGWGIIDSHGTPKAPYYALRQLLQPRWVGITDEGLNGLAIHVGNELALPWSAQLDLALYRQGHHLITRAQRAVTLAAHDCATIAAGSMLGEFHDLTHAYRFGPLSCDLVVATLGDPGNEDKRQAFYLPYPNLHCTPSPACTLAAQARAGSLPGRYELTVRSSTFARSVRVDAPGYTCDLQYFHLAPDAAITLELRATSTATPSLSGSVSALNAGSTTRIEVVT